MKIIGERKTIYVLVALSFLMIFGGAFSCYIDGLKKDHEMVSKRAVDVNNTYEELSTNVSLFEDEREKLYGTSLNETYFDNFYKTNGEILEKLSNFESMVNEIEKKVNIMNSLCDSYYMDASVNNKCSNYKLIYEQVNNYFVSDIDNYNKNVKTYNLVNVNRVNVYQTNRKYIDYNKDKTIDGKM
ncbi:MAG: hypothetical protein IJL76_02205 [Bacilli bacterium]|nr:hypothetical protein [Bacilli bacterium]